MDYVTSLFYEKFGRLPTDNQELAKWYLLNCNS